MQHVDQGDRGALFVNVLCTCRSTCALPILPRSLDSIWTIRYGHTCQSLSMTVPLGSAAHSGSVSCALLARSSAPDFDIASYSQYVTRPKSASLLPQPSSSQSPSPCPTSPPCTCRRRQAALRRSVLGRSRSLGLTLTCTTRCVLPPLWGALRVRVHTCYTLGLMAGALQEVCV